MNDYYIGDYIDDYNPAIMMARETSLWNTLPKRNISRLISGYLETNKKVMKKIALMGLSLI